MPDLDYGAIIAAGHSLIPDFAQQTLEQNQQRLQQRALTFKMDDAQRGQVRKAAFDHDVQAAVASGNVHDIQRLMVAYPEFADQLKPGVEAYSQEARQYNQTQIGTALMRVKGGDPKGAADLIERHHNAEVAAGHADDDTGDMIAALRSGDPDQIKHAQAAITMRFVAEYGDKAPEVLKTMFPAENNTPSGFAHEYDDRVARFGKTDADRWKAEHDLSVVTVDAGGRPYNKADFLPGASRAPAAGPQPRGGDPTSGGASIPATGSAIESAALGAVPDLNVTSRWRSAAHNAAVGGVSNSYHLTDQARDFTPPAGMPMGALAVKLRKATPGFDVINEGTHVHVEPGPGMGRSRGPVRVGSIQQAMKLPAGTVYTTPDNRTFRR